MDILEVGILVLLILVIVGLVLVIRRLSRKNKIISRQSEQLTENQFALEEKNLEYERIVFEKNSIMSMVSHDLKAPLNRVFALLELMKIDSKKLTETQLEYLEKIETVVTDGIHLIRNLMDIRSLEDKGVEMEQKKLNIVPIVKRMVENYQPLSQKKKIDLHFECSMTALPVMADKLYLDRVLENLISNAVKFTKLGGTVHVTIKDSPNYVLISFRDQGPGIPVDERDKLFNKYQPLSVRPTGGESSNGLGLAIVKMITEKFGGKIEFETEIDKGSTFTLHLKKEA